MPLSEKEKAAIRAAIAKKQAAETKSSVGKTEVKAKSKTIDAHKPAVEKGPVGEYDPYEGLSEDELGKLLDPETPLRRTKVQGEQAEGTKGKGVFGSGVSVEEFRKRNPEWAAKFKKEHGVDFDPKTHAKQFQDEYNNHVEALAKKRAIESGYTESEAAKIAKRLKKLKALKKENLKKEILDIEIQNLESLLHLVLNLSLHLRKNLLLKKNKISLHNLKKIYPE